jgi:very-short-patch-repair endonuclease
VPGERRLSPTLSEACLWHVLQGSRLGVGFRRQAVISEYIVHFLAPAAQLAG